MIQTKPDIKPNVWYTQSTVSRRLQITIRTLQRAREKSELAPIKRPSGAVEFLGSDVLLYWEKKRI